MRVNPLPSSTLFYKSPFTITICGENGDQRRCDNNNGENRVSGGGSSKIELRCFSGSSSASRCFSANNGDSCNNNDVWRVDNGRSGERKRIKNGRSCNNEVKRCSESSGEHNGVGS